MLTSLIIAARGASALYTSQLDHLESAIKKEVPAEATRKQALAIVSQAQAANKTFTDDRKKMAATLASALGSRTATAEQIEGAMKPLLAADSTVTAKMVDTYVELRPVIGAADWAKVFPAPGAPPAK